MFTSPSSIAFSIGNLDIYWYGIIMSLSMLFGLFTVLYVKKNFFKEITNDSIFDISFILIIVGILSARLYYVLIDFQYFIKHPTEIFAIWNGGISIQGAIIGGTIAFYFYAKENNLNFFRYADLLCFGVVTGQILGRWGNFFNSEAFGLPTDLPWKLYIPYSARPIEYKTNEFFHPTFLYESICSIIIFIALYTILIKKKDLKTGTIFLTYICLYSIARIFIEKIRIDSVLNIGTIPIAQITSSILIFIAIICLYYLYSKDKSQSL